MNREVGNSTHQDALDRIKKAVWREQEGWCSTQEATDILTVDKGPQFHLVEAETETIP